MTAHGLSRLVDGEQGPRVFVSYARDLDWRRRQVGEFCEFLQARGANVQWDERVGNEQLDWLLWAIREMDAADRVLVIASAGYRRWAEGETSPGVGGGVAGEAAFLRDRLVYDRPTWHRRILPVILPGCGVDDIPLFLSPYTSRRFEVTAFTDVGAASLLRVLGLA